MSIEDLNLIQDLEGKELEIDFNIGGVSLSYFISQVHIEEKDKEIILDDLLSEIAQIHIKEEEIVSVEEDGCGEVEMYMLHGQVNFIEM